jgi:hypothetical protein
MKRKKEEREKVTLIQDQRNGPEFSMELTQPQKHQMQLQSLRSKLRTFKKPKQTKCGSILEFSEYFLPWKSDTTVEGTIEEYPFDSGIKCILF